MATTAWQSQTLESTPITLKEVRERAEKLNRDLRAQVAAAYVGVIVCAGFFALTFAPLPGYDLDIVKIVLRFALLVLSIGGIFLVGEMRRRAKELRSADRGSIEGTLDAYRAELRRRRNYYLDAWRWSFLPAICAVAVIVFGGIAYDPGPAKLLRYSFVAGCAAIGIVLGVWLQSRKGAEYQNELDALRRTNEK